MFELVTPKGLNQFWPRKLVPPTTKPTINNKARTTPLPTPPVNKSHISTSNPSLGTILKDRSLPIQRQEPTQGILIEPVFVEIPSPVLDNLTETKATRRIQEAIEAEPILLQSLTQTFNTIQVLDSPDIVRLDPQIRELMERADAINILYKGNPHVSFNAANLDLNSSAESLREAVVDSIINEDLDQYTRLFASPSDSIKVQLHSDAIAYLMREVYLGKSITEALKGYQSQLVISAKAYLDRGFPPSSLSNPQGVAAAHNQLASDLGIPLRFIADSTGVYPTGEAVNPTNQDDILLGVSQTQPQSGIVNGFAGNDTLIMGGTGTNDANQVSKFLLGGKGSDTFTGSVGGNITIDGSLQSDSGVLSLQSDAVLTAKNMEDITILRTKGAGTANLILEPDSYGNPPMLTILGDPFSQELRISGAYRTPAASTIL
jgi:hypothetical protein